MTELFSSKGILATHIAILTIPERPED